MDLLSSTLGAIGQVGEGLDKYTGGRAVRGTLAGKPRELLSVLPFSDSAGITNHADATSGRDLTDQYGITSKGSNSFGSHAAGFLADNVLSPANWLGAGAAYKAAPTIAKGITSGAKALTGLDLLDHVAGGAKKLGGFLGGEAGSAKIPPLPIDVDHRKATSLSANVTRPRRFSVDPARKDFYQADRNARYARKMIGRPRTEYSANGIPEFHLNDAIKRFGADESGSLRLPFDHLSGPPAGMLRSDPEWVNNRTGYHGTGIDNLESQALDPTKTDARGLYGRGIYNTDSNNIARSYSDRSLGRGARGTNPTVYQSQSSFGKILDLDEPATQGVRDLFRSLRGTYDPKLDELLSLRGMKVEKNNLDHMKIGRDGVLPDKMLDWEGLTPGAAIQRIQGLHDIAGYHDLPKINAKLAKHGVEFPDRNNELIRSLRSGGYDALTHTGGEVLGGPKHQVTIGLDPNDVLGTGRKTPYSIWEAIKNFGQGESGYLRHAIPGVPEDLANAMDGLGPQYPGGVEKLKGIVEGAGDKLSGSTSYDQLGDLNDRLNLLMQGPHAEGVASEIPEGSRYLGAGMEGITFRTPDGAVIRLGDHPNQSNRADIPEMLQAYREAKYGPYKVEHMPQVAPLHEEFDRAIAEAGNGNYSDELANAIEANNRIQGNHLGSTMHVQDSVRSRGLDPWDASIWNTGMTPEGNAIIFDGGAVKAPGDQDKVFQYLSKKDTYDAPEGDLLRQVLAAGGPEKVRESLKQGLHMGTVGQGIWTPRMAQILNDREVVQKYLASKGVDPGMVAGWRGDTPISPAQPSAGAASQAPGMGKLYGTLGATAGGGALLAYLLSGSHGDGNPGR